MCECKFELKVEAFDVNNYVVMTVFLKKNSLKHTNIIYSIFFWLHMFEILTAVQAITNKK